MKSSYQILRHLSFMQWIIRTIFASNTKLKSPTVCWKLILIWKVVYILDMKGIYYKSLDHWLIRIDKPDFVEWKYSHCLPISQTWDFDLCAIYRENTIPLNNNNNFIFVDVWAFVYFCIKLNANSSEIMKQL